MNGIIRNFVGIKVICHFLITGIWIYWGIFVHPLTSGWLGWSTLIGGGILYFIGGGVCLIADHESDVNVDFPGWALGHSMSNLLLLGSMVYCVSLYPNNPSFLLWPAIIAATTLLLYGFNGFVSASLLLFITVSLWLSNWGLNRWYDYCILIVVVLIGIYSIITCSLKEDEEVQSKPLFWLVNFGLCSIVNIGLLSLLYFNDLLYVGNDYNVVYLTIELVLFSFVVSTRFITILLSLIAWGIYWWKNTEFSLSSLIPNLSFEWIHEDSFIWCSAGLSTLLLIIIIISYYKRRIRSEKQAYDTLRKDSMAKINSLEAKIRENEEIIRRLKQSSTLSIEYKGLTMTCPHCRKTMVTGKYDESTMRGIAKTTTKGLIGLGGVGSFAAAGSLFGPIGTIVGTLVGGAVTYYNNKNIDKGVDAVIDMWNYEVDGGRSVYFKCPKCGHEWEETETYGEIEH